MQTSVTWLQGEAVEIIGAQRFLTALSIHAKKLEMVHVIGGRTRSIRRHFATFEPGLDFCKLSADLNPNFNLVKKSANFRVDGVYEEKDRKSLIALEYAFNNREAIGTNFLKLALALKSREVNYEETLAVLVAPSRALLERGGWDGAYADSSEYRNLHEAGFGKFLGTNTVLVEFDVD
jgi:hypothetical protein